MRLRWWRKDEDDVDARIAEAERKACDLDRRSEKVAADLTARLRRNHWGQTVAEIARGER